LHGLRKILKRVVVITTADLVTLASADAIENAGGSIVVVQLGKGEPKPGSLKVYMDWSNTDLSVKEFINAFRNDVAFFRGFYFG